MSNIKNIFWKVKEYWCPYPANNCIEERTIIYSTSKKFFDKNIFAESPNTLSMHERKIFATRAFESKFFPIKINLIRLK